ncbi:MULTISPECIES: hypothetical protein [Pseudomonas]|uniref:Uncharacterized protein n=1 Tax=Pseudomonas donghuensis TaxID=1163398 RepID=A0AAP0SKU6_9PSED|nr:MULTISPECIES: hypothetical protein [Pseudomonas]MCE6981620.1 hypothetical protein [Pseudomonas frederiksbergensis]MDF9892707.1 hypothetical protein [Pseudomonas vranovensis]KDO01263.2 hypothetical protein BV82_1135 [Pseudomonas donghuensis]MBF4207827.1 hypothetical protein [Pseudomonas donghuensis]MBS7600365.1 hypothetical protein [Pseudomonas sp. RC2C2]
MHENTEFRREARGVSYTEYAAGYNLNRPPRFVVVPAGIGFFHITEQATGRVKGFRREHTEACALARHLEN